MTATSGAGGRSGGPQRPDPAGPALDPDEPDHYQLLGVPYAASAPDITRAYRAAMKRIHPDRQRAERRAAAEETAKRLNVAYTTLRHPVKRQAYDRTIRARLVQDQLMSRYVGGFYPASGAAADRNGASLRREPTGGERREQAEADRTAFVSLLVAFSAFALLLVVVLVVWGVLQSLLG